ncbi:MAG: excinuclease ABC subunit UvrB [Planctomycetes bacterium]|nr:excinuclease ABC subunit UvrB [Planctomycetota bacterium]
MEFRLVSKFKPDGDQPPAIRQLVHGLKSGARYQTLLGVTGSGKTFTMANIIQQVSRPTLVLSPNKTLAAQLYSEFKEFFPHNAVHYFVSYYDYYQPEAYLPQKDIYIEKDAAINENLERLRLAATSALMSRQDVIIVASVSCIYALGSPQDYAEMTLLLRKGENIDQQAILKRLVEIQYERNEMEFKPGLFRVRGESIEIFPSYEETAVKIIMNAGGIRDIARIHPVTKETITPLKQYTLFAAKHFVMPPDKVTRAIQSIRAELKEYSPQLKSANKLLEAKRLETRTNYDMEMLTELGYCKGIENYSRHFSGRIAGQRPDTLIDYFPDNFLCFVDESHTAVPQVNGMYHGDRSRKEVLIEYGFRLPSALDNRPMRFEEWEQTVGQVIFVSATPGPYEVKHSAGQIAEQIIRPTGLVDPKIEVRPIKGQIEDLIKEMMPRIKRKERILVTTLTKRLAEDLSYYLQDKGIKGKYLHSEIDTIERTRILRALRERKFDVLVGVNLLREGLDLPEVSLVVILDADKEGFLRSTTSIIQTVGRTARNINGLVVLYADQVTASMQKAIDETTRRRNIQLSYNKKHKITPKTINKEISRGIDEETEVNNIIRRAAGLKGDKLDTTEIIRQLTDEMLEAAKKLKFEDAAQIRDTIEKLHNKETKVRI